MAQMTILTRQDIEGCLKRGMSVPQIATRVGKTPQAITAELKTRRIDSNKGLRRSLHCAIMPSLAAKRPSGWRKVGAERISSWGKPQTPTSQHSPLIANK